MKSLRSLVREFVEAGKDTEDLLKYVNKNPQVWTAARKDRSTAWMMLDALIRNCRHGQRRTAAKGEGDTPEDKRKRMEGMKRITEDIRDTLFDWPVWSGKPIRRCTLEEIDSSVEERLDQNERNEMAAEFEKGVAKVMRRKNPSPTTTCGEIVTDEEIRKAHKKVYGVETA